MKDSISPSDILFEDNHLMVLNKRAGQIVQGDKTGDEPLSEILKTFLKITYQKPGNVFLGVVHRIDRPVTGVVLFAKTSKALSRMNEKFRERAMEKTYWAVVRGKPRQQEATLVHYLEKNEKNNTSRAFIKYKEGALRSELAYRLLLEGKSCSLLEVKPVTGRHHQIRVQLAASGLPIVGDVKYGDKRGNLDRSICLHARKLVFLHPVNQTETIIEAPTPAEKHWEAFKKEGFG